MDLAGLRLASTSQTTVKLHSTKDRKAFPLIQICSFGITPIGICAMPDKRQFVLVEIMKAVQSIPWRGRYETNWTIWFRSSRPRVRVRLHILAHRTRSKLDRLS